MSKWMVTLGCCVFVLSSAALAGEGGARVFTFTYAVDVHAPEGTRRLDVWVPLPIEDGLQQVADLTMEARLGEKPVVVERTHEDTYGNRFGHVRVEGPAASLHLAWTARITRATDEGQGTAPLISRYREADRGVPVTGRAATLAHELGADDPHVPVRQRAKRIYDHVLGTMVYDKVAPGWGKGDFERACDVGKGNCTDFHAKFIGIGRAAGIPVRFTMGIPLGLDASGSTKGYHCWAHFHDGARWIPVDISEAQKIEAKDPEKAQWFFGHLDPDRIALSVGRDITLAPPQQGPPLLHFVHPYAEADGVAFDIPTDDREFSWR